MFNQTPQHRLPCHPARVAVLAGGMAGSMAGSRRSGMGNEVAALNHVGAAVRHLAVCAVTRITWKGAQVPIPRTRQAGGLV
ncbi:MAG TPA: hypothetical protein VFL86_26625 [Burkholderiaceae bacterium]|nr:hypothetical protein [Burkholderiaceae bacterium]